MKKYVLEIKNRLILLSITCLSTLIVSYFYKETLLFLLTQSFTCNSSFNPTSFYFIFTDVTEIFSVYVGLISFITLQILVFGVIYHSFIFFSPALFSSEYLFLSLILKTVLTVWFLSAFLSSFFLIPFTWNFFLSFQDLTKANLHFEAKLNEYFFFYTTLYYLCIFYCLMFAVIFLFLGYLNVNVIYIKKFRKLYYYFFIIFSTLLSPPEIYSQIILSTFIISVYEFLLFLFVIKISSDTLLLTRQPVKTNEQSCSEK